MPSYVIAWNNVDLPSMWLDSISGNLKQNAEDIVHYNVFDRYISK